MLTILHKFSKLVNGGGRGVKNPQISVNVVYGCPLAQITRDIKSEIFLGTTINHEHENRKGWTTHGPGRKN